MSLPREGSRTIGEGIIVAEAMDWCRSPTAIVPYRIYTHHQVEGAGTADSVRQTDERSHVRGSLIRQCYGDEPGVGGGVRSGTRGAECEPKTWSSSVRAEGRPMVRHDDEWWMNHRNTYGRLTYVEDAKRYETPEEKEITPRMQVAQAATGTMSDAPALGAGSTTRPSPQGATPGTGLAGRLPGIPASPSTSTPSAMDDAASVALGAARGGVVGAVSQVPGFLQHSEERLKQAISTDQKRRMDEMAQKNGFKDWDDFVSQMKAASPPQFIARSNQNNVRVSGGPNCKDLKKEIHKRIYGDTNEGAVNKGLFQRRNEQINGEFGPGQMRLDTKVSDGVRKFKNTIPWETHEDEIYKLQQQVKELYQKYKNMGCENDLDAKVNKKDIERATDEKFNPKPQEWKGGLKNVTKNTPS